MKTAVLAVSTTLFASSAQAALKISNEATRNVTCASGVCTATAKGAVLNVTDLANMLASGSTKVKSGSKAQDIVFDAPLTWTSANALTLDADRTIRVTKTLADSGPGSVTLNSGQKDTDGYLSFVGKGQVSFLSTANVLRINGEKYSLQNSLPSLISAIAANPSGFYALANSYDASADGEYSRVPIDAFNGTLQGLGNVISNLTVANAIRGNYAALVGENYGTISDLVLSKADIHNIQGGFLTGGWLARM